LFVVVVLIVAAVALLVPQIRDERDTLIRAYRGQHLAVGGTLRQDVMTQDAAALAARFARVAAQNENVAFIALIGPDEQVLAHSDPAYQGETSEQVGLTDRSLSTTNRRDITGYGAVYVTTTQLPLSATEAYDVVIGTPVRLVDDEVNQNTQDAIIATAGLVGIAAVLTLLYTWRIAYHPAQRTREAIRQFRTGDLSARVAPHGAREFTELIDELNALAAEFDQTRSELEELYHASERQAQERARDMAIAADVGRRATGFRNIQGLLRETVDQLCRRFDEIYHAQVFLIDDLGEYAVLVESTGEAGRQLLAMEHKLAVGSDSVIGRVTARGRPVNASDTLRGEVPWQPNPILPDTRAELALPLQIEERVIGALDVQSIQPDVFTPAMIRVFAVAADQLAIAIENARLLAETEQRVSEIDNLNRQLTRATWQEFVEEQSRQRSLGYRYNLHELAPLEDDGKISSLPDQRIEADIRVRGETIGKLATALPGGRQLTDDDQILIEAVADRVALAVENARLFGQTQRALAETERLYDTARAVSSTSDLNVIYQLVTEQLSMPLDVDHVEILLSGPDPALVQYLENVYIWSRDGGAQPVADREQLPVLSMSYAEDDLLSPTAPTTYDNIPHDMPPEHPLHDRLAALGVQSAVLAPLNAGGRWFGILVCSSQQAGGFGAEYVSFASALADQLAIAVENRRLFDEAQTEARRARALAEAGQLASQIGGDYEAGLQSLFEAVAGPGQYDRWWFGLLDGSTSLRQVTASDADLMPLVDIEADQSALAEAARIGEIVLVNDPTDHPVLARQERTVQERWGKHIAMPVKIGPDVVGVMQIGRALNEANLDERDIQLAATLASQIAVATQNQQLFDQAESERQNLQTILDTMPTGVLVMDNTGQVILSNERLRNLLGPDVKPGVSQPETYPMLQGDTREPYPREAWPLNQAARTGEVVLVDDLTVQLPDGRDLNLLAQAAPIHDADGEIRTVVGAFQDITELQELEQALQDSLRETTMLYEASRAISRATNMEDLLQVALAQISTLVPDRAFIFLDEGFSPGERDLALVAVYPPGDTGDYDVDMFIPLMLQEPAVATRPAAADDVSDLLVHTGLHTMMSFPLSVRGHVNGWIVVGFEQERKLPTEQRRLLTTLSNQAAMTIENQHLLLRTETALQDTAVLYHASRSIAEAEDAGDILQTIISYAAPPPVSQAMLYVLLGDSWEAPNAAVEVVAGWDYEESDAMQNAIGTRYLLGSLPFGDVLAASDVWPIDDVTIEPGLSDEARDGLVAQNIRAATVIPLRIAGRPLGALLVGLGTPWEHGDSELRVYQSLVDQAAVSLENTRLYQQMQRRARQLGASVEVSRAVTSILDMDTLLPQVVDLIRDAFGYDHAQVFLMSDDDTQADLVASTGEAGRQLLAVDHSLPVGSHSVIGQVTANGEPVIALDTADARFVHRPNPYLPDTRSEMALPLIARGQILGALDVQSNQSGAFTEEDTRILAGLADQVATAIDNARLFALSEERAEEMEFLFNVTTAATTSPELAEALEHVVETLQTTMGVSRASVFLPDQSGDYLRKGAGISLSGEDTAYSSVSVDRGLLGWVARHKEATIINDLSNDPRRLSDAENIQAAIAVPLMTISDLVGVLLVESEQAHAFDNDDLRLLQTLSGSLGAIIQNSRLLQEMQEANERLLEVDRLKTNFLAAMSHELRTPLNSIIGFSRVMLKEIDGPLTSNQEEDLTTIYESGKHLLGLVNDILDQAKIEAGKMELSLAYFDLQEVINGVMSTAVGLTRDKPIELKTDITPRLPQAYGDEFRTRQVLLNLVSNASKFTTEGSISVSAFPIVEDGQEYVQLSVEDTGIGIAQKDMSLLFEAFQQVDNSTTRSVEGTGMGLPLAKSLVELQGGRIWVVSEPNVGSTFSVTIPTSPVEVDDTPGVPEEQPAPASSPGLPENDAPPLPQRLVLVIENDPKVLNLYYRYLAKGSYEILGTTYLEEARQLSATYHPLAILLDVNLPHQDGWAMLEALTHSPETADVPVIVCSMDPDKERGLELGAIEYLVRPFTEDQLLDAMQRAEAEAERQRILLVDDKPESVRVFRDALAASPQYRVMEATTGQQALELLERSQRIDLVILDLRMPEIDGFEVLHALRTNDRTADVPVLVLTAEDINADERAALESIDVFRKDAVNEDHLLDQVESYLDNGQEQES
jgi:PAS domain S-box-containing protein